MASTGPTYDAVYYTLRTADEALSFEDLAAAVDVDSDTVGDALDELDAERAIRYNPWRGGYVLDRRVESITCAGCGGTVAQDERSFGSIERPNGGRREFLLHEACAQTLLGRLDNR